MTDRSSQPCSSDSEHKTLTTSVGGVSKTFTIKINKSASSANNSANNSANKSSNKNTQDNESGAIANTSASTDKTSTANSKTIDSATKAKKSEQSVDKQDGSSGIEKNKLATADNSTPDSNPDRNIDPNKKQDKPVAAQTPASLPTITDNIVYPDSHRPAIIHALFDPNRKKFDPARPLTDFPEPAPRDIHQSETLMDMYARFEQQERQNSQSAIDNNLDNNIDDKIRQLDQAFIAETYKYNQTAKYRQAATSSSNIGGIASPQTPVRFDENTSKWQLIHSPDLSEHIELLQAGGLAKFPASFYKNASVQPLLSSIETMKLVDMSQILATVEQLNVAFKKQGVLTKQGFVSKRKLKSKLSQSANTKSLPTADDILNLNLASEWESILYPQRFDTDEVGYGSLTTDIMAVSVVKHALLQCPTRQSINKTMTATDIANYLRSYLLSQCNQLPHKRDHLKHIHIYAGHVIVVARMLGWQMAIISEGEQKGEMVFNVSSRCGLFARYPVLDDYYLNGWH